MIYPVIENLAYDGHNFFGCFEGESGRGEEIEKTFKEIQADLEASHVVKCRLWHKKKEENGGVNEDPWPDYHSSLITKEILTTALLKLGFTVVDIEPVVILN
jgi:hypothetical protein